ncbi:uncharacterized protein LOC115313165 [Ixodes scapularis]|uniref:uncharacterized protein LOC115313165 n=1 Tax=Ixodes scapularis TaxID=6945 RepID=UPI001A9F3496|nr:uncharacterized protein LOC115313165 [Ixodes scapularis]
MGMWRHNRCPLLLNETELRCTFCASLSNTFRIHKASLDKRGKEQRVRMPLSPSKKKKIDILRRQRIACSRSKVRLLKRNRELEAELSMCKKDLEQLSSEKLNDVLKKLALPEPQQMLLRECISAAKCTSSKGRRYTDDWLLLCLLLHIRSPAGYRLLRENDVLPLPCVKTIRRYIAIVGIKCGFDVNFFAVLKRKLQGKSEFQRHGMLLFDEIQVRERKAVNSKTLSYTGLVDHGDTDQESSELANHGLVFMFCPFGESYAQPVAVFAS